MNRTLVHKIYVFWFLPFDLTTWPCKSASYPFSHLDCSVPCRLVIPLSLHPSTIMNSMTSFVWWPDLIEDGGLRNPNWNLMSWVILTGQNSTWSRSTRNILTILYILYNVEHGSAPQPRQVQREQTTVRMTSINPLSSISRVLASTLKSNWSHALVVSRN